jgi:Domain of unknown function (DUF4307)
VAERLPGRPLGRYGPPPSPRRRRLARAAGAVAVALALAWVLWAAAGQAARPVRSSTVGYSVLDERGTEVTFDVVQRPGAVARCRVRALDASFAEVGRAERTVGPSSARAVRVTAAIPTVARAVTAEVVGCDPLR